MQKPETKLVLQMYVYKNTHNLDVDLNSAFTTHVGFFPKFLWKNDMYVLNCNQVI